MTLTPREAATAASIRWCAACGDRPAGTLCGVRLSRCVPCHRRGVPWARPPLDELGRQSRVARLSHGLSVQAFADLAGVSTSTIKRIEAGRGGWPRSSTLRRLGDALETRDRELRLACAPLRAT